MDALPPTPFESGWWSFDLGTYRPCDSTYCLYKYEDLPPIPEPDPMLSWLGPLTETIDRQMEIHRIAPEARGQLGAIATEAQQLGLALPDAFVRLMSSSELQNRIPSCTACTFGLGDRIFPCPGSAGAYLVSFLRDQQDCVIWFLYLTSGAVPCVAAFPGDLEEYLDSTADGEEDMRAAARHIRICAPSFEAFIFRFWLENTIWFKLSGDDKSPLTDVERRYLEHYERLNQSDR